MFAVSGPRKFVLKKLLSSSLNDLMSAGSISAVYFREALWGIDPPKTGRSTTRGIPLERTLFCPWRHKKTLCCQLRACFAFCYNSDTRINIPYRFITSFVTLKENIRASFNSQMKAWNRRFSFLFLPGTSLQIWGIRAKVFLGISSPQTKNCGWLIDWSIVLRCKNFLKRYAWLSITFLVFISFEHVTGNNRFRQ